MTPKPPRRAPRGASAEFSSAGELVIDGHRWFDLDLAEHDYRWLPGKTVVASAAIDLAAEGLLAPRQLADRPDPVTRLCLTRAVDGRLDYFTWGDLEFLDRCTGVLRALGHAALASGTISGARWVTFVVDAGLD